MSILLRGSLTLTLLLLAGGVAVGQESDARFHRAYFLEHESSDLDGAMDAYRSVLKDSQASKDARARARQRMAVLREERASSDLAQLMPDDTIVFVELAQPAAHLENIAQMMGLTGEAGDEHGSVATLDLDDGLQLRSDFQISPALIAELNKIRGAAAAITGFHPKRGPTGVLVVHPGQSDLVRGLIETGIQVVPQDERIGGFPAYAVQDDLWIVKTERLFVISPSRELVSQTIARLRDPDLPSLATRASFRACADERKHAALFVCVDGPEAIEKLGPMMQGEAAAARVALDLDHLKRLTAAVSTTAETAGVRVQLTLDDDHNNLLYGLIRTNPQQGRALKRIPAGAAVVATLGLNPQIAGMARAKGSQMHLTAWDLGRELFANIEEIGVFVIPELSEDSDEVPDFGIVIASNDAAKSTSLWNQMLSLPATMGADDGPVGKDVEIAGQKARRYTFPDDDAPVLVVSRLDEHALILGTPGAVESAVVSFEDGETLVKDGQFGPLVRDMSDHTSKAVLVNVGRVMQLAGQIEQGKEAQLLRQLSEVFANLKIAVVSDERPDQLTLQCQMTGLPRFANIVRTVSRMQGGGDEERVVAHQATADEG